MIFNFDISKNSPLEVTLKLTRALETSTLFSLVFGPESENTDAVLSSLKQEKILNILQVLSIPLKFLGQDHLESPNSTAQDAESFSLPATLAYIKHLSEFLLMAFDKNHTSKLKDALQTPPNSPPLSEIQDLIEYLQAALTFLMSKNLQEANLVSLSLERVLLFSSPNFIGPTLILENLLKELSSNTSNEQVMIRVVELLPFCVKLDFKDSSAVKLKNQISRLVATPTFLESFNSVSILSQLFGQSNLPLSDLHHQLILLIPYLKSYQSSFLAQAYFQGWLSANTSRRQEINCLILSLLQLFLVQKRPIDQLDGSVSRANFLLQESSSILLKKWLNPFLQPFTHPVVIALHIQAYKSHLSKYLKSANAVVRANSIDIIAQAFQCKPGHPSLQLKDHLLQSFHFIRMGLNDTSPLVRQVSIESLSSIMALHWDLIPFDLAMFVIVKLATHSSFDFSSPLCRHTTLKGILHLASQCSESHGIILHTVHHLEPMIRDDKEAIRVAFLDFLVSMTKIPGLEGIAVLSQSTLISLLVSSTAVASRASKILLCSLFTLSQSGESNARRCWHFASKYPRESKALYSYLFQHLPQDPSSFKCVAEFIAQLANQLLVEYIPTQSKRGSSSLLTIQACFEVATTLLHVTAPHHNSQWFKIISEALTPKFFEKLLSDIRIYHIPTKDAIFHLASKMVHFSELKTSSIDRLVSLGQEILFNPLPQSTQLSYGGIFEFFKRVNFIGQHIAQVADKVTTLLAKLDQEPSEPPSKRQKISSDLASDEGYCLEQLQHLLSSPCSQRELVAHPKFNDISLGLYSAIGSILNSPDTLLSSSNSYLMKAAGLYFQAKIQDAAPSDGQNLFQSKCKRTLMTKEIFQIQTTLTTHSRLSAWKSSLNARSSKVVLALPIGVHLEKLCYNIAPSLVSMGYIDEPLFLDFIKIFGCTPEIDTSDAKFYADIRVKAFDVGAQFCLSLHNKPSGGLTQPPSNLKDLVKKLFLLLQCACASLIKLSGDDTIKTIKFLKAPLQLLSHLSQESNIFQEYVIDLILLLFRDWEFSRVDSVHQEDNSSATIPGFPETLQEIYEVLLASLSSILHRNPTWMDPIIFHLFRATCNQSWILNRLNHLSQLFPNSMFLNFCTRSLTRNSLVAHTSPMYQTDILQTQSGNVEGCFCPCSCGRFTSLEGEVFNP